MEPTRDRIVKGCDRPRHGTEWDKCWTKLLQGGAEGGQDRIMWVRVGTDTGQ